MLLALVVFFALLEAVFTALEVAFGSISRTRLRALAEVPVDAAPASVHMARRAAQAMRILNDAPRLTLTFIIITSLSLWSAASLLTWIALSENWEWWALPVALIGVLFVAEVLPVLIAAPRAETIVLRGSRLIGTASSLLTPFIWFIGGAGRALARILGANRSPKPQVTEDELRSALAAAEEEGAIESGERSLLEGAMDFRAKVVREVMTSRMEIVSVTADASLSEILQTAVAEGHSRLPVYESSLDKIFGIISTKDLLPYLRQGLETSNLRARDLVRPPFFVPENKRIAAILDELRQQRTLMAIVVGDDGATIGLVTLEDLLEEIVGDILDETDQEEPEMEISDEASIRAAAHVTVREAERFWEKAFPQILTLKNEQGRDADDTISLAALALHLFDGVPGVGDRAHAGVLAEGQPVEMEIIAMNGPRIEQIRLAPATGETLTDQTTN